MDVHNAAVGGIYRDFEADVLQRMTQHGAKLHGCPLYRVVCKLDGSISFRFKGLREGMEWEGGMSANLPLIEQKKAFSDPEAVTQVALAILEKIGRQTSQPLIQRAN